MLIRLLVEDDQDQARVARDMLAQGCIISSTVLIEVEWVLRSFYRWPRDVIAEALGEVIDLPMVTMNSVNVRWAIGRFAEGADFADMMHIVSVQGATGFATFDREVGKHAGSDSPVAVETLI